ncbi:MAG: hypothetical protein QXN77_08030 [Candidatus Caldarchaeum sp.]
MSYDPSSDLLTLLQAALAGEQKVFVEREWVIRNIDVTEQDYVLIRDIEEEYEFLGIGGMEFTRTLTARVLIKSAAGRERVRKLAETIRNYLRAKENWSVSGRILFNLVVRRTGDFSVSERGIWSQEMEIIWFQIEVRT